MGWNVCRLLRLKNDKTFPLRLPAAHSRESSRNNQPYLRDLPLVCVCLMIETRLMPAAARRRLPPSLDHQGSFSHADMPPVTWKSPQARL